MMARVTRRLTGSLAAEMKHPLRLWQREKNSHVVMEQARLLLVDVASERARAGMAELTTNTEFPLHSEELKRSVGQWRSVAAGVAVGDAACLIALARGLADEQSDKRLGAESSDAALTALNLAARSGTDAERIVAGIEALMLLPELIGKCPTTTRRARALSAMFRIYKALIWSASCRRGRDQQGLLSAMIEALAIVEAAAIRRNLFAGDLDRKALFGRLSDLSAAEQLAPGDDDANRDEASSKGSDVELPLMAKRTNPSKPGREEELPAAGMDHPLFVIPFPGFDPGRLSESRKAMNDRYAALRTAMPLTPVLSQQAVETPLQALAAEMPNFLAVTERIRDELALARCTTSQSALRLPPMLFVGPPGIGKTRFASRLAGCLGLPSSCLVLAGSSDNRELAGTARGWSSAHPGWPVEQLVRLGTANPLLVIDEIDKAGGSDHNGNAVMTLLTLLERETSKTYHDECLGGPIDLSLISWVFTANSTSGLPGPLLSRLNVVTVQAPAIHQFGGMLATMLKEIGAERGASDPRMLPALPQLAFDRLRGGYALHGDPRRLRAELVRMLGVLARADELLAPCPAASLH